MCENRRKTRPVNRRARVPMAKIDIMPSTAEGNALSDRAAIPPARSNRRALRAECFCLPPKEQHRAPVRAFGLVPGGQKDDRNQFCVRRRAKLAGEHSRPSPAFARPKMKLRKINYLLVQIKLRLFGFFMYPLCRFEILVKARRHFDFRTVQ